MREFDYERAHDVAGAVALLGADPDTRFLGGGTNLVDLMKDGVEQPTHLVDVNHIGLDKIEATPTGAHIGASARNSTLANHPGIVANYPLLSHALLAGASPQLRNMATTAGNLMQRTRCPYFMDPAFPSCNKRAPGTGCGALTGYNRYHAILGQSDDGPRSPHTCIATHPSDMCVALYALNAQVEVLGPTGKHTIPITAFHRLPSENPARDTVLHPDELITAVILPAAQFSKNSWYLKARDRNSYAFALVSVAAGLEMQGATIRSAGLALGGVAHKPWRSREAEAALTNQPATAETFRKAADLALRGAHGYQHNTFKIELARQCIVRALTQAAQGVQA